MKSLKKICAVIAGVSIILALASCSKKEASSSKAPENVKSEDGKIIIRGLAEDGKSVSYNKKVDNYENVIIVDSSLGQKQQPFTVDLSEYANQEIGISFKCNLKVENPDSDTNDIIWMINDYEAGFPELCRQYVKTGEWTQMSGHALVPLGEKKLFFISASGLPIRKMKFYLQDFEVQIETSESIAAGQVWTEAPSLKEAYKDYFDIGIACEFKGEFNYPPTLEGLSRHANTVTMGNEFKPDFLFAWQLPRTQLTDFTGEDGKTYKVPSALPKFSTMDMVLSIAQEYGFKVRGHVLVWHSQTPKWFFKKDYNVNNDYVSKSEMTARQEWYIKSVLEHVKQWEEENNNGERIITVWDVVNEACADNSTADHWLREDSDWYRVYEDETFIVNAFKFANKYAPKDVQLCYNDYGCYGGSNKTSGGKTNAVLNVIRAIQACPEARIDVLGMQSHMSVDYPAVTGDDSYETAVKKFLATGVDVQVTELDIANGAHRYSPITLKARYRDFYNLFIKYAKKHGDTPGISNVTVWGINDERTWLNGQQEYKNLPHKQCPLLFEGDGDEKIAKPCFYGILEVVQ